MKTSKKKTQVALELTDDTLKAAVRVIDHLDENVPQAMANAMMLAAVLCKFAAISNDDAHALLGKTLAMADQCFRDMKLGSDQQRAQH